MSRYLCSLISIPSLQFYIVTNSFSIRYYSKFLEMCNHLSIWHHSIEENCMSRTILYDCLIENIRWQMGLVNLVCSQTIELIHIDYVFSMVCEQTKLNKNSAQKKIAGLPTYITQTLKSVILKSNFWLNFIKQM